MIYDHIDNLSRYASLDDGIRQGLELILQLYKQAQQGILPQEGSHPVSDSLYYNIDSYTSKLENSAGYEAHRKYIDIQFLLRGKETIRTHPLEGMRCTTPYDNLKDAGFYQPQDALHSDLILSGGHFAIFHPTDAHMPQLCIGQPSQVLKVVVKVRCKE